jgi:hypothetical protein
MKKTQLAKPYVNPNNTPNNVAPRPAVGIRAQPPDGVAPSAIIAEEVVSVILGADHTAWRRDIVTPSSRARRLLAMIKPFLIRVLSFWDHRITRLSIEGRELFIDQSGSYQVL